MIVSQGSRVISLCSGTGALDLALSAFGCSTALYAERDPNARTVLLTNMERGRLDRGPIVADMASPLMIERAREVGRTAGHLVVAGGIPCQGNSVAGGRRGHADERNLWPAMREIVKATEPEIVLLENVRGLLSVNPSEKKGVYPTLFGSILGDLAAIGYSAVWTSRLASDANAPHKRDRVFLLAYPHHSGVTLDRVRAPLVDDVAVYGPENMHSARAWPWPRFPGLPQHPGEVPRLSPSLPRKRGRLGRGPRLKLLGNAVVPQQAVLAIESLLLFAQTATIAPLAEVYNGGVRMIARDRRSKMPQIPRFPPSGIMVASPGAYPRGVHGHVAVWNVASPFTRPRPTLADYIDGPYLASGRFDADAESWPTPDASASNVHESIENFEARRASWKEREPTRNGNGQGTPLGVAVRQSDWGNGHERFAPTVAEGRRKWPTLPDAVEPVMGSGLYLNPDWVEQLMGLPVGWTDTDADAK